jgi:protein-disulfide isomerase
MSGKQSKRRRREVRRAEPAARPRRQASPKVLAVAAIVVALAAVGAGTTIALRSESPVKNVQARGSLAGALPGAADVHRLLTGIAQHENVLGARAAPVTLVEYVDLQCPYCREFDTQALPELVKRFVRTGTLKVELRPLAFIGPDSVRGRAALLAAGKQSRLFDFMQLVYLNQGVENTGWLDEALVERTAASIPGLDVQRLLELANDRELASRANAFDEAARAAGVSSTPTIYVGKSGGVLHQVELASPADRTAITAAIRRALG